MATRNDDPRALAGSIEQVRALRREILRREILQQRRIDLLATDVLGYELRPFHAAMLAFQEAAADIALQLAPRGYGKSTVLTIARAVYEVLRNPNIRILIASNTQHQAEVFLREIKFHLALNEKVIDAFGRFQDEGKWDARETRHRAQHGTGHGGNDITCDRARRGARRDAARAFAVGPHGDAGARRHRERGGQHPHDDGDQGDDGAPVTHGCRL